MTARAHFDFTGTRALITGGTSGIGHAIALISRDGGADVTVTGTIQPFQFQNAAAGNFEDTVVLTVAP